MLTKFYKDIFYVASGVIFRVKKFKTEHPDENIIASGVAKKCLMNSNNDILDLRNWKSIKVGIGILTDNKFYFNNECFELVKAKNLELIKFKGFYGMGQMIKYVNSEGIALCFSMQYDDMWTKHICFKNKVLYGKLKGLGQYILMIILFIIIWFVVSKVF